MMLQQQNKHLYPMGWVNIIDYAFSLYRGHFQSFLGIVAMYAGIDALRECVLLLLWKYEVYHLIDELFSSLLMTLVIGMFIVCSSEIYLDKTITFREILRRFGSLFSRYLHISFVYLIPISLWELLSEINKNPSLLALLLLLLSIPFLFYYYIAWCLYGPVVILETPMSHHPLTWSRYLVKGAWWRICGTIIAVYFIMAAIELILNISIMLIFALSGYGEGTWFDMMQSIIASAFESDRDKSLTLSFIISAFLDVGISAVITTPIYAISVMLIYFNRKIETERFDIVPENSHDSLLKSNTNSESQRTQRTRITQISPTEVVLLS